MNSYSIRYRSQFNKIVDICVVVAGSHDEACTVARRESPRIHRLMPSLLIWAQKIDHPVRYDHPRWLYDVSYGEVWAVA